MSTGALIDGERTELERLRAEVAALLAAVQFAYGRAWAINDEPLAPVPMYTPARASIDIRKRLLQVLTPEQKRQAIADVIAWRYSAMSEQAMQVLDDPQAHGFALPPGHGEHQPLI